MGSGSTSKYLQVSQTTPKVQIGSSNYLKANQNIPKYLETPKSTSESPEVPKVPTTQSTREYPEVPLSTDMIDNCQQYLLQFLAIMANNS